MTATRILSALLLLLIGLPGCSKTRPAGERATPGKVEGPAGSQEPPATAAKPAPADAKASRTVEAGEPARSGAPAAPAAAGKPPTPPYSPAGAAHDAGAVRGRIRYVGPEVENKPVAIGAALRAAHPERVRYCALRNLKADVVIVNAGGLANAVVEIQGIERGKAFGHPVAVVMHNCRFSPRVVLSPRSVPIVLSNADPFPHHPDIAVPGQPPFWEVEIPGDDKRQSARIPAPNLYALRNSDMPWMRGALVVMAHPYYAVTAVDGSFSLEGVPPGKWKVRVWHEKLGTLSGTVEVRSGETTEIVLEYGG